MAIHTDMFRGFAQDNVILRQEKGGYELFNKIKENVTEELKSRGIPFRMTENEVKSGGLLFGSKYPILIITHPDFSCKYFQIGICVNGNQISFPLLGESAENTKANKKDMYEKQGSFFKSALVKPDMFKLQQEANWQRQVLDCFNSLIS